MRGLGFARLSAMRQHSFVQMVNRWMRSGSYFLALGIATAVCNVLELDLLIYTLFIAVGLWLSLMGEDYLPLVPVAVLCYVAPSVHNNPGRYPGSVFYPLNGGIYLGVLFVLFLAGVIWRLSADRDFRGFLREKRELLGGMGLLAAAYLFSGICSQNYEDVAVRNLIFALVQGLAVGGMYFFFAGSVKWDRVPEAYLGYTGLTVGYVVLLQLLQNYLTGRIFVDGTIDRELIATGWGMHNNIGGMLAMTMPFAFSLATRRKHGWVFTVLGTVLMLGVLMSCSRGSMLAAALAYAACAAVLLRDRQSRRSNLTVYLLATAAVVLGVIIFFDRLADIFRLFLSQLGNISQRDNLVYYGVRQFLREPVFGGTFYPRGEYIPWDWANLDSFSSFFPPRWHNTLVQIGASCGVLGLTAYGIHRFQTVRLYLRRPTRQNTFAAISISVLLLTSLLDCHFFNIGPVLLYSIILAFMEKSKDGRA